MKIANELKETGFTAGIVKAEGVCVKPSCEELTRKITALISERAEQEFPSGELRTCVRKLLKKGGFKPTGRNKPASEYLAQAAKEGRFPSINNLVDINNYLSLLSGLPVSLLDLDVLGEDIVLRLGREGESFVFNASGHVINVKGLINVCRSRGPALGNPVKDSMECKIREATSRVIGVTYTSGSCTPQEELREYAETFARLLRDYGEARDTEVLIV